jgi:hypothetical protein
MNEANFNPSLGLRWRFSSGTTFTVRFGNHRSTANFEACEYNVPYPANRSSRSGWIVLDLPSGGGHRMVVYQFKHLVISYVDQQCRWGRSDKHSRPTGCRYWKTIESFYRSRRGSWEPTTYRSLPRWIRRQWFASKWRVRLIVVATMSGVLTLTSTLAADDTPRAAAQCDTSRENRRSGLSSGMNVASMCLLTTTLLSCRWSGDKHESRSPDQSIPKSQISIRNLSYFCSQHPVDTLKVRDHDRYNKAHLSLSRQFVHCQSAEPFMGAQSRSTTKEWWRQAPVTRASCSLGFRYMDEIVAFLYPPLTL